MKMVFSGTRGEIEEENPRHKYHSSIVISGENGSIVIDFGEKHSEEFYKKINCYDGLLVTHAHPDHYIWTKMEDNIITIPVFLTETALNYSVNKPLNPVIIRSGICFKIKKFEITPYNVIHSLRCPAVCFKIGLKSKRGALKKIIYAPDILDTEQPKEDVLKDVDVLIADGSSFDVNLVRNRGGRLFGHATIKTIANWCIKYGVPELIITHCGKQIVTGDEEVFSDKIHNLTGGMLAFTIAYDGLEIEI